jgi:malonyl-CoA O-methyltransferase
MSVKREICKAFNSHAAQYEQAAKVQREIGDRLFERLQFLNIKPRYVLDLGCGPGAYSLQLKKYYPKATVVGLDLAYQMLQQAKMKQGWRNKWSLVNGDMTAMPFATGLFDLVFANQVVHWSLSLSEVMSELNRVMNPGACLMFSTLGPDTFFELRQSWSIIDEHSHTNDFLDMHHVGDVLLAERFLDPVIDMEMLTAHYPTLPKLLQALKAQGVRNVNSKRNSGLTGKQAWSRFEQAFSGCRTEQGKFPLTYEVVYGHAWKGEERRTDKGIETMIPVSQLRRSSRT